MCTQTLLISNTLNNKGAQGTWCKQYLSYIATFASISYGLEGKALPFYGMLKFLWLPRTPKYFYLYLQAFLVKHAIDIWNGSYI